jgi:RND family efflux transporter MFP subunit
LVETDAVSKQAADEKISDASSKLANVNSLHARVKSLESMVSFKKVTSPFDGKVTSRTTDIGALINAANNGGEVSAPMFTVADTQKLRVYVNVPQLYADKLIKIHSANLVVPEYADKTFKLTMNGISGAVSEQSGSVLVQFELDNKEKLLNPGSYGQVEIQLPADASLRKLPVTAIMVRNQGVQVATVDSTYRVKIKTVKTGNDYGSYVEVLSGLTSDDRVINSPPDLIEDGQLVKITDDLASKKR